MFSERMIALEGYIRETAEISQDMVGDAVKALLKNDQKLAKRVYRESGAIANQLFNRNLKDVTRIIARFQPKSQLLRQLISTILVNRDLDWICTHAENIAFQVVSHCEKPIGSCTDIPTNVRKFAERISTQLDEALTALVNKNDKKARWTVLNSSILREKARGIVEKLQLSMDKELNSEGDSDNLWTGMIMIVRCLERIGIHATNIAKSILFVKERDLQYHLKELQRYFDILYR